LQTPNLEEREAIGGRGWYYSKERWSVPISSPYILFLYQHSFARNFRLQFSVRVANPRFWGRGGRRGSEMVPFERALVSFYRPSTVTFPLSFFTRFRDIAAFVLSMPLFPTPLLFGLKFRGCSLRSRSVMLGSAERRKVRLISREIISDEFKRI